MTRISQSMHTVVVPAKLRLTFQDQEVTAGELDYYSRHFWSFIDHNTNRLFVIVEAEQALNHLKLNGLNYQVLEKELGTDDTLYYIAEIECPENVTPEETVCLIFEPPVHDYAFNAFEYDRPSDERADWLRVYFDRKKVSHKDVYLSDRPRWELLTRVDDTKRALESAKGMLSNHQMGWETATEFADLEHLAPKYTASVQHVKNCESAHNKAVKALDSDDQTECDDE